MKAARLHEIGAPLVVEEVAGPELRPGAAVVRVEAVFVAPTMLGLLANETVGLAPRPFTPGPNAVGRVESVAEDVSGLAPGTRVYCDGFHYTRRTVGFDDSCFIGAFAVGAQAAGLQEEWRDGSLAEKVVLPAHCLTPLGAAEGMDPGLLCRTGWFGTAFAGLRKLGSLEGRTVLVNAATGLIGVGAVLLALASGAARVVAVGRQAATLEALAALDPERVRCSRPEEAALTRCLPDGRADLVVDALGTTEDLSSTQLCLSRLGRGGKAVLIGAPSGAVALDYWWTMLNDITVMGSIWFEPAELRELLDMIGDGRLDTSAIEVMRFPLEDANAALASAAARPGGFHHVAVCP
jgi:alcohol dehydrogenase